MKNEVTVDRVAAWNQTTPTIAILPSGLFLSKVKTMDFTETQRIFVCRHEGGFFYARIDFIRICSQFRTRTIRPFPSLRYSFWMYLTVRNHLFMFRADVSHVGAT
jgi:hypothetical protein